MAKKHSAHLLELAKRGAEARFRELVAEAHMLASADARKPISDAQNRRWAKQKRQGSWL